MDRGKRPTDRFAMSSQTRLLFVAGSARAGSFNKRLARLGADIAHANGIPSTFADLGDYPMPLYDGDVEAASGVPENARKLLALMAVVASIDIQKPAQMTIEHISFRVTLPCDDDCP